MKKIYSKKNISKETISTEKKGTTIDWKDSVKKYLGVMLDWSKKNKRYLLAGCLMIAFVFILVFATNGNNVKPKDDQSNVVQVEKNKEKKVQKLVENYYKAYQKADFESLKSYVTPISENEAAYITMFAAHVEKFTLKDCYTKKLKEKGSFLVSAHIQIKFKDVEVSAPGLDFFVIKTAKDGRLYVDNIYSQFNLQVEEFIHDKTILSEIHEYEKNPIIIKLQGNIQDQYDKAIKKSPELKLLVEETIKQEISTWFGTVQIVQFQPAPAFELPILAGKDTKPETPVEPPAAVPEEPVVPVTPVAPVAPVAPAVPAAPLAKYQTKAAVNMRETPSVSANTVAGVPKDGIVKYLETSPDGTWSKVSFSGFVGYIKNEFLDAPTLPNVAGLYQGEVLTVTQTVNVRESMSETGKKLGTAFKGEFVTVIAGYAEGWTLVSWNGQQGYVLTSLILQ